MDIRELRYFVQVAEHRSFTKAAIHLRIAQPAISRQVRKLEEELGVELLIRAGHGLRLTAAGNRLLEKAYQILEEIQGIGPSVRAQGNRISGTVSLGIVAAVGEQLVPPLLLHSRELYPELRIDVTEGLSHVLYERVLTHRSAISVMYNPVPHRELEIIPLLSDEMYLFGPGRKLNGLVPAGEVSDVSTIPLILPPRPHSLRSIIESALDDRKIPMMLSYQVEGSMIIRSMVRAGLGYSISSYEAVRRDVETGLLSARKLENPSIASKLCLVRRKEPGIQIPVGILVDLIVEQVARQFKRSANG